MSDLQKKEGQEENKAEGQIVFRLYVAGRAPNSALAITNLKIICQEYLPGRYQVEIVDVLEEPLRAINDGVLVTPTLLKVSPLPEVKIIGNLNEKEKVLQALDLRGDSK